MAKTQTWKPVLAILAVILIGTIAFAQLGYLTGIGITPYGGQVVQNTTTTQPTNTAGQAIVNKPLKITLMDQWAGSAVATATVSVMNGQVVQETLTTDSAGQATTAQSYASDSSVMFYIHKSGYQSYYQSFVVPRMYPADAQSLSTNAMLLYITLNPTITYQVVDQGGAVYTTAVTKLNFTTLGVTSYTVHVTLYNSVDNSGVVNCLDIVNNLRWDSWLVWSNTTYTSFNGHISVQRGTTIYGLGQIQGSSLIRQKIGNAYPQMGTVTFDITFNKGSLAHGSIETISIKGYEYFDESSFALTGSGGSSATQLGSTFNLVLAA